MARSLLDRADLPDLRRLAGRGPAPALAACLVDTGLLQLDPDDPDWEDRDRLVVCGAEALTAVEERLVTAGIRPSDVVLAAVHGGDALATAFGAAAASALDGGAWRSWCLLSDSACDDGRLWEIAAAAADSGADGLGVLVAGTSTRRLWEACGWTVHRAPADDPAWLLGAMDQAIVGAPAVVLAAGRD